MTRAGRWRRRLAALALGGVLGLGAAELAARATWGAPLPERLPQVAYLPHATRGFALIPGDVHYTYGHEVRVNSLGLRGPEVPPPAEDQVRILFLGDSLTFGHGVAQEDTVPARLERLLQDRAGADGPRFVVVNGGHQAYSTKPEIELLRELGPVIRPDVVLLGWLWNDIYEVNVADSYRGLTEKLERHGGPREPRTATDDLAWTLRQTLRKSALLMRLNDWLRDGVWPEEEIVERFFERTAGYLDELVHLSAELDCRPVVVILPDFDTLVAPNPTEDLERRMDALAAARGLPVIHVKDELRAEARRLGHLPLLPHDRHYDADGNGAIARAVADGLERHLGDALSPLR